jgi:DNA-binding NarL/FixJ family response regulator
MRTGSIKTRVPAAEKVRRQACDGREGRQILTRIRVLLADDYPPLLESVTALLRSSFDVVGTACNGQDLISQAMRLHPDVIVADITMPVLTGIEAAHQLRKAGSGARFVFLTVHPEDDFVQACQAEGALGYVVKSHLKTDLVPAINAALSGQSYVSKFVSR